MANGDVRPDRSSAATTHGHPDRYRAVARFDGRLWNVLVEDSAGRSTGGLAAAGLDLVEGKTRRLVEDPTAEVTVEAVLPADVDQRLQVAEQLCEDAERELEGAIVALREQGFSVGDVGFVFMLRHLRPEPRPLMISNAEIAEFGLSRHPDAVGIRWSDHGFAETTKCRRCVEATRTDYVGLPEDGVNELLYDKVDCDFFDSDHIDDLPALADETTAD